MPGSTAGQPTDTLARHPTPTMDHTMPHTTVALSELVGLPRNPKRHDVGVIHTSIDQYGFLAPIVINTTTGHILSGHGRRDALQQKKAAGNRPPPGITTHRKEWLVPVHYVTVDPDKEEAAAIALNRAVELGGWDTPALAAILADHAAQNMLPPGFDGQDVDDLLASLAPDQPKPTPTPTTQEGDPWPVIRVQVDPDVKRQYDTLMATLPGDEAQRFEAMVDRATARHPNR